MKFYTFLGLLLFAALSTSCVSKKKFEASLAAKEAERLAFESKIRTLDKTIADKNVLIDTLELRYSSTMGANQVLLTTQDKLLDRIDEVQAQLENERKDKSSTTQGLNSVVSQKDNIIRDKDAQLGRIKGRITKFEEEQTQVINEFRWELEQLFAEKQSVDYTNNEIRITLEESLLFRPSQARVRTSGIQNLQKIAELMNKYPTLKLYVIGNTDNKRTRNFKDNWDYSVIRASNVVKVLTREYDLSPNRVIAAGKGEFAPKASNQTREGQAANRRIDFVILPRFDRVVKDIKKELGE
jgi:chemotaxis protein MotB